MELRQLVRKLKPPNDVRDLALVVLRNRADISKARHASPDFLLQILKRTDAFRRADRFADLLKAARLANPNIDTLRLERAQVAASAVDTSRIARDIPSPDIARHMDDARREAIAAIDD